jgi:hypothetical protein
MVHADYLHLCSKNLNRRLWDLRSSWQWNFDCGRPDSDTLYSGTWVRTSFKKYRYNFALWSTTAWTPFGEVEIWLHEFLTLALEVVSFPIRFIPKTRASSTPPTRNDAGWAPDPVWTLYRKENLSLSPRMQPHNICHATRSLVAIRGMCYIGSLPV